MNRSDGTDSREGNAEDESYVEKLEQYRRRLDGAMFAGELAWWEMDVQTGEVAFHEQKADFLGMSPDAFDHYEDFTELIHEDDYERAMGAMRDHLEGRAEKYDVEYRIQTADGEYVWFHDIGGVTEWTDDGAPSKVTGIVVHISSRKEAEQQLRKKNEQLSLLNRILRHDISNDMNIISGWVEVLAEEMPPDQQDKLDRIRRASEHTAELTSDVRDLLDVLEGDASSIERKPVDLGRVLRNEVERVTQSFDDVVVDVPEEMPDVEVEANGMLHSVVGNLLNNAVRHNDADVPRVDIGIEVRAETVTLTVADNGPGIPEDQRDDIFQQDVKGLDSEGTGIGLYLVDTLVQAFGGTIRVEDNEPGAVFAVELQRAGRA